MLASAITCAVLACVTGVLIPVLARTRFQLRFPSLTLYVQLGSAVLGVWFLFVAAISLALHMLPALTDTIPLASLWAYGLATLLTVAAVSFWIMATAPVTKDVREVITALNTHVVSQEERPGFTLATVKHTYPAALSTPPADGRPGTIMVTTGLRDALTSGQLQAVLAHEYAHVTKRHGKILSILTTLDQMLHVFAPLKRSATLLVELAADDIAAKQAGPAELANALAVMAQATGDETMFLRAERLTTKKWPREHWRTIPEPIRVDKLRT